MAEIVLLKNFLSSTFNYLLKMTVFDSSNRYIQREGRPRRAAVLQPVRRPHRRLPGQPAPPDGADGRERAREQSGGAARTLLAPPLHETLG